MNALVRARQAAQADIRLALRRRRRALGLTQEQAGRLLGMSRLTYHRIETGARRIQFAELGRICGPNLRRPGRGGADDVGDGVTREVIDLDQLGRIAGLSLAPGDDERDGIANMAHAVAGERGPVRRHHAGAARYRDRNGHRADAGRVESGGGQHREYPRCRLGGRSVDAADVGERMR